MLDGAKVWVVDANSLIFQVYHAIPEMTSPRGEPVNALYGFTRDILRILLEKKPDYLFVAFDPPGETFRHEMYEKYKEDRSEMPEDLRAQFPGIRQVLESLSVPILEVNSFEADDVLATVARRVVEEGGECVIVTSDKDCRQLLGDHVRLYNARKDAMFDTQALADEWGIRPEQVVDFQALVGDSVDNVPGVPLIGPKLAGQMLEKFGSLDELLERADEVSGKKRKQNLIEGKEQALLSRRLVTLASDVPLEIDWEAGRVGGFDRQTFMRLLAEFGFRTIANQFDELQGSAAAGEAPAAPREEYHLVGTEAELDEFAEKLRAQTEVSLDTETTSVQPMLAELVGMSFAWEAGEAWYLPLRAPAGDPCLPAELVLEKLRPVLEDPHVRKVGQNLKYDFIVLRRAGVELKGLAFDTMVASYLIEAGSRNYNLDQLAARYLDRKTTKITELIGTGKDQKQMDEVPVAEVCHYAGEDADLPLRLLPILQERLDAMGLSRLLDELEMPLVDVLAELEFNGIRVDPDVLGELSKRYQVRLEELRYEIYELAGKDFNVDSPKQLQHVLFDELGLPVVKRTKSGPSTDVSVLEELAALHELPEKIIQYRQFAKLKGTYVDSLPALINPRTGRVHCSFNQVVAATGRLSSSEPNLQNIPIRTERGREIRSAFLPGEAGWKLLAADYSQIELRILAHFSQDETLCAAFARDEDIHAKVASQVFGVPLAEVSSEQRRRAKAVNFGVIYGQSPFGLARQLGIPQEEAATFIDAYFAQYPGVRDFLGKTLEECRLRGYVSTILGRRREIRGVRSGTPSQRNLPERTAINTVIQGSAADLIKQAMVAVYRRLNADRSAARMLLQIHDELIFEAPADQITPLATLVSGQMTDVMQLRVPLKVDVKTGDNWAELEPVD